MRLELSDECAELLKKLSDIRGLPADQLAGQLLEEGLRKALSEEAWRRLKEIVLSGKGFLRSLSDEELDNIRSLLR